MILETERLYLREFKIEDKNEFKKILMDREAMKYFDRDFSEENVTGWINFCIKDYKDIGHSFWAVIRKSDNKFLGDCGITMQDIDGEELPEVGFHFNREFWGQGYATEAALGCIKYGFDKLNFDSLYSYMTVDNIPSQNVAKKAGMKQFKSFSQDGKKLTSYKVLKEVTNS